MTGIIGAGNMASAIIGGIISSGLKKPHEIIVSDSSEKALDRLNSRYPGIITENDNCRTASRSDMLILAVKPNVCKPVLQEISGSLKEETPLISIAAGVTLDSLERWLGKKSKIIRTMPNTPALVGEGMTALSPNPLVTEEEIRIVEKLFSSFSKTEIMDESKLNAFTAVCGSSPAWIFMAIEALADGAVNQGLPRDKAYKMVSQAVLGSAKMVLETGKHPAELKDQVTSPAGTTIEAVASLEKSGFRNSLIEAVKICKEKADSLSAK